ncbi:MAG TPA: DUF167 domain-containing protein [Pyrinomonadaceae bacterium]|jgi:hypothetical protein|nr:DUF167 domain-containing protein [Pyrinomonadaceae bacterium]
MIQYSERDGALIFMVRVVARASRSSVAGEHDGALRVRVAAPPVDGAANEELLRILARAFEVPTRDVLITSGHSSRLKQVRVKGATYARLNQLAEIK